MEIYKNKMDKLIINQLRDNIIEEIMPASANSYYSNFSPLL